jgi:hypothetical protein
VGGGGGHTGEEGVTGSTVGTDQYRGPPGTDAPCPSP